MEEKRPIKRAFTTRVDEEVIQKVAQIAKKQKRSLASQIELILEEWMEQWEKQENNKK